MSAAGGRGDETWCVPAYLPDNSKCACQWQERTKRRGPCATPVGVESCRCARDKRIRREASFSREGSIWSSARTRGGASVGLPFRFSGEHEMHATLKPVIGHQAESPHREISWTWNPASGDTRSWAQVTRSDLQGQGSECAYDKQGSLGANSKQGHIPTEWHPNGSSRPGTANERIGRIWDAFEPTSRLWVLVLCCDAVRHP